MDDFLYGGAVGLMCHSHMIKLPLLQLHDPSYPDKAYGLSLMMAVLLRGLAKARALLSHRVDLAWQKIKLQPWKADARAVMEIIIFMSWLWAMILNWL